MPHDRKVLITANAIKFQFAKSSKAVLWSLSRAFIAKRVEARGPLGPIDHLLRAIVIAPQVVQVEKLLPPPARRECHARTSKPPVVSIARSIERQARRAALIEAEL
jgi:hypothetical protein